ncbi:MAG: IS21 family transposase [Peptococcaceae bacterium]|nr:IS21 family transposase [Peptococcaceae bacterium]
MSIEVDIYEKIRYLHEHEGKSQRAISTLLGISRNTVKKYCEGSQVPWERQGTSGRQRYMVTDEIMDFIKSCLETDELENIKKQKHTAKRIYDRLVQEKGFKGGESTIREIVAKLKDKQPKVFVPLAYDPGEAIQIDWGEATVYLSGKKMKVNLFCMRECYSADMFCKAFYRQNEESFLEGQISGFDYFEGAPKRLIFDNAKVAVKEGFGVHAKPQDRYKALAAHYAFQCKFCNIAAGHEKSLVEGLVGWVRRNILVPIPRVETIDELNAEILRRCLKYREHRIAGRDQTVGEMALTTRVRLTKLPRYRFDPSKSITQRVSDFSTVRFDYNHYSVPVKYADKEVSIKGYGNEVVMIYRNSEIARYPRCYERGQTKYRLEHYIDLIEKRPRSVFNAKPVKNNLSTQLLEIGRRLSGPREMVKLLRLCVDYGEDKILATVNALNTPELSVEQIRAHLTPISIPERITPEIDIKVTIPEFDRYDALIYRGVTI